MNAKEEKEFLQRRASTGGTSGTVKCDGGTQMDGASADARFAAKTSESESESARA